MQKYVKWIVGFVVIVLAAVLCWAAVTTNIGVNLTISGLGNNTISYSKSFSATTPDAVTQQYRVLDVNGESEAIALGDVSTVEGIVLACVDDSDSGTTGGLWVDCNYVTSFTTDIVIPEGQVAYFKPIGLVYVVGANSVEKPTYEYVVLGTR